MGVAEPGATGLGDRYFPSYGNGGYDVDSYDIALTWTPIDGRIDARTTIRAVSTQPLSSFNLELKGLEITSVSVDGSPAEFARDGQELTIDPTTDLGSGVVFVVEVAYSGEPGPVAGEDWIPGGWMGDGNGGIIVFGEPEGAASWYPVNDHPSDKATYRLAITVPSDLTVAANGIGVRTDSGPLSTWKFAPRSPQASYLTTVVIGDYEILDGGTSTAGTPIRNVVPRGRAAEYELLLARQPAMIDALEGWFGPYPFEVYGAAAVPLPIGGAIETQTLSIFDVNALVDSVVVHELAHQWYGDSVGIEQWSDIWLNEGFASYAELLWREATEPAFDITVSLAEEAEFADLSLPPGDPGPDRLFDGSVYRRGAMTLHAVRLAIGDEDFRELMTAWSETFVDSTATTGEFVALAEATSGEELSELFDAWLFSTDLPDHLGEVPLGG